MKISIVGAGALGMRVSARLSGAGEVLASTRTRERFAELEEAGATPVQADLAEPESLRPLLDADALLFCVAPGFGPGRDHIYGELLPRFAEQAAASSLTRLVFTSSTAVYEELEGDGPVTERTPARASSRRGLSLLEAEQALADRLGERLVVLRPAGLYARGRGPFHYLEERLAAGEELSGAGDRRLNLIHYDDVAALAAEALIKPGPALVLGADGRPGTRRERYGAFCRARGYPEPRFAVADGVEDVGKRIVPEAGFALRYPDFDAAIAAGAV